MNAYILNGLTDQHAVDVAKLGLSQLRSDGNERILPPIALLIVALQREGPNEMTRRNVCRDGGRLRDEIDRIGKGNDSMKEILEANLSEKKSVMLLGEG